MDAGDLIVEVRDVNLVRLGQVEPEYLILKATVRWCAVGDWELRLPAEHPLTSALTEPGSGLIVTRRGGSVLWSGPTRVPEVVADANDPNGLAVFTGVTDDVLLWHRLCYPTATTADVGAQTSAYDTQTGPAETVMRHFVDVNLGPSAPTARRVPVLSLDPDLGRGAVVGRTERFSVVGDVLAEIAAYANLGFRVVQVGTGLVLKILTPSDVSGDVRFDLGTGTLTSQSAKATPPSVTRAIVAGQGEGAARTFVERASTSAEVPWGPWGRIETFVDQRQTDVTAELEQAGDKALASGAASTVVSAVPGDDQVAPWPTAWDCGDLVAVVVTGTQSTVQVTSVALIADENGVRVGAGINGSAVSSSATVSSSQVSGLEARVSQLERIDSGSSSPTGTVSQFAGTAAPAGWAMCDGGALNRTTDAALFSVIGTTYGAGDGSTTFNVPNLSGRFPLGASGTHALGSVGGEEEHTLTVDESPPHTHHFPFTVGSSGAYGLVDSGTASSSGTPDVSWSGGGQPHNNMPPYLGLNFIIKT